MKRIIVLLSIFYLAHIKADIPKNITELYKNVEIGWPSPTPWIKERFNQFLQQLPKNAIVAEVGVQAGSFSYYILKHTDPKKLYLIDCWEHQDPNVFNDPDANVSQKEQDKLYEEVKRKFLNDSRVEVLRKYSKDAAILFEDESLDWVYIDSNHGYEAVKEDLQLWYPKVKSGGYICGHDYIHFKREGFGITKALNEFMRDNNLYFSLLTSGDVYESWAIKKP